MSGAVRTLSYERVVIPPNVTATVVVPGGETVEVGSGRHAFTGGRRD